MPLYFFAPFPVGWCIWVYVGLRVVTLSEAFGTVKACYAVDMAADDQIKDCCRACALVWRSGG